VRKQLDIWGRLCLLPGARRTELIERALETFELDELARARVDRISMGQRQRVRLAMAFMHQPDVVMLDEPLTSLDRQAAQCVVRAVEELRARDGAVLWCSPEPEGIVEFDAVHEVLETKLVRQ
jgi:ABC-type multidrug transport system ATPase subunit